MPQAPVAGTAYLKIGRRQYPIRGKFSVSPSAREMKVGKDGAVHGYEELPRVPFIDARVSSVGPGLTLKKLERLVDSTIVTELVNGKIYVLNNAGCRSLVGEPADGTIRMRFEGLSCDDVSLPPGDEFEEPKAKRKKRKKRKTKDKRKAKAKGKKDKKHKRRGKK